MTVELWYIVIGLLLTGMAFWTPRLHQVPITTALIYLFAGAAMGPLLLNWIDVDPLDHVSLLERLSEVAVIISLFAAGLKLTTPLNEGRWWIPVRLAFISMAITVALIAAAGVWLLDLPLGAAVLLGAVLAPTDPVLASEVEIKHPGDRDNLRFGLTGEAALNDGTAFPFVMLGLGLLGLHDLGSGAWRWWAVDVLWAIGGGLAVGAGVGWLVARVVVKLRQAHRENAALDDFLALGVLAFTYGAALLVHTYAFLAAFTLGLAMRRVEQKSAMKAPADVQSSAREGQHDEVRTEGKSKPDHEPHMTQAVLGFNEQLVRFAELALVVLLGAMLFTGHVPWQQALWFVPLLLLVIRPLAVWLGLVALPLRLLQRPLIGWFGIRGIGSIYYLMYGIGRGVEPEQAKLLLGLTLCTVAVSITVHGISVTPLMAVYERTARWRAPAIKDAEKEHTKR